LKVDPANAWACASSFGGRKFARQMADAQAEWDVFQRGPRTASLRFLRREHARRDAAVCFQGLWHTARLMARLAQSLLEAQVSAWTIVPPAPSSWPGAVRRELSKHS
jgi:hypothetical protein